jgi:hypothetical protein
LKEDWRFTGGGFIFWGTSERHFIFQSTKCPF